MDQEKLAEMLKVSKGIMDRGDSFRMVLAYLKREGADEKTIESIMSVLDKEDKERKQREAPQRIKEEKKKLTFSVIGRILIGFSLLVGCGLYCLFNAYHGVIWFLPVFGCFSGAFMLVVGIVQLFALPFGSTFRQKANKKK